MRFLFFDNGYAIIIPKERCIDMRKNALTIIKQTQLCAIFFLLASAVFVASILCGARVFADNDTSAADEINIKVSVSCTISGTGMDSHIANISNGDYQPNIGSTVLHAFCNDNEGFAIYAAGYTGDEVGGTNSNKLVGTVASREAVIESGIATSAGSSDVSNWAMKLALAQDSGDTTGDNVFTIDSAPNVALPSQAGPDATSASFTGYHVVPNEYVKVAHKNSVTDMTATTGGVKLTTTYAAYVSKSQPADTYSGQVIYTLVHPAYADAFGCNPNATTIGEALCMQDISTTNKDAILASMNLEQQYSLKDKRDSKSYTVAKLKDGKVWMTQNLDLDIDANTTYTNKDTDLGWNESTGEYGEASWKPERSTYETGDDTWGLYNSSTRKIGGHTHPESYDPGDVYWNGALSNSDDWSAFTSSCTFNSNSMRWENCNETLNPISNYITNSGGIRSNYHFGNYYNWTAAIAMNDSSVVDGYGPAVSQSICPTGWTLPIGAAPATDGEPGSFQYLIVQYGWTDDDFKLGDGKMMWDSPLNYALTGTWDGLFRDAGADGLYHTSEPSGDYDSTDMWISSNGTVSGTNGDLRFYGHPVRCVTR